MNDEAIERHLIAASVFKTGNQWLDDALGGGLNSENFLMVAAKTGTGKTFFGVQLATAAAKARKNVKYFALEAEKHEIERRRLYYAICRLVHKNLKGIEMPRYREWLHIGYDNQWNGIEEEARKLLEQEGETLHTVYATGVYTPEMFAADVTDMLSSEEKPDLVILDHLHHFFLSGDEVDALKTTIHQLKRIKDDLGVPVVILAQLRKNDGSKHSNRTLPKIEDIRGTASLSDVATDVLIISKVSDESMESVLVNINFPMYFHLAKSRTASEATSYAGIVGFDFSTGTYAPKYVVTDVLGFDDPVNTEAFKIPRWAKNAITTQAKTNLLPPLVNRRDYE